VIYQNHQKGGKSCRTFLFPIHSLIKCKQEQTELGISTGTHSNVGVGSTVSTFIPLSKALWPNLLSTAASSVRVQSATHSGTYKRTVGRPSLGSTGSPSRSSSLWGTVERDEDNNNTHLELSHLESRTVAGRYRDEVSGSWIFRHRGPSFDSIRPLLDHTDNNTDPIPTSFWVSSSSSHTSPSTTVELPDISLTRTTRPYSSRRTIENEI
jgi:hypothetical protein